MGKQEAALVLTLAVHVLGTIALIWVLVRSQEDRGDLRHWWRGDDDGGSGPPPPGPAHPRGGDLLPLPDATQSAMRLRGGGRLADAHRRPRRGPGREPAPAPQRQSRRG